MGVGLGRGFLAVVMVGLLGMVCGERQAIAQPCEPEWAEGVFGYPGIDGEVRAAKAFDDGSGEALYIGGAFSIAGKAGASNIARWDGTRWSAVGGGVSGTVYALEVFDDGRGAALFAAGSFDRADGRQVARIARWDGVRWEPLGGGIAGRVDDLEVFDDGRGERLYAAGLFTRAGGVPVEGRAVWDGSGWASWGAPLDADLRRLLAFEDAPGGPALLAASVGPDGRGLWLWDGVAWGQLFPPVGTFVWSMVVADTGAGEQLHVGGRDGVVRWDGAAFEPVGDGLGGRSNALRVHDDGRGPRLYAAGEFVLAPGGAEGNIAVFDGGAWVSVGAGLDGGLVGRLDVLEVFDDGVGPRLFAGGVFTRTGAGVPAVNIAAWDGMAWRPSAEGLADSVWAIAPRLEDGREVVYAAGEFIDAGGDASGDRVARWADGAWTPLGSGFDGRVNTLEWLDDGTGVALYAGGRFQNSGGSPVNHIARWDGAAWRPIGDGIDVEIRDITVFDDGSGPALFAAGGNIGPINWYYVWKFDGTQWVRFGDRFESGFGFLALAVFDDGTGETLYAGGDFDRIAGAPASNIARWDGTAWRPVGDGAPGTVYKLLDHDDGSGPALYATGAPGGGVQRWDGSAWNALTGVLDSPVSALASVDDPDGPRLLAGKFEPAFGEPIIDVLSWDGAAWTSLPGLVNGSVRDIQPLGQAAFLAGDFRTAGGAGSAFVARWGCIAQPCPADLDGDGELTIFDFLAFQNLFQDGDPIADFDGDGELTIFDFLAFQNAFDAGCG